MTLMNDLTPLGSGAIIVGVVAIVISFVLPWPGLIWPGLGLAGSGIALIIAGPVLEFAWWLARKSR